MPYLNIALGQGQLGQDRLKQQEVQVRLEQLERVGQLRRRADEHQARVHHSVRAVLSPRPHRQRVHHLVGVV